MKKSGNVPAEPETYWDMMKDPDCTVRVRNLTHVWGRTRALDQVGFTVRRGEIFGLAGPNGAGKTTLLKILATLVPPSKGQVYVMRHSVRKRAHFVRINIGFMPDSTGIKEDMTVREYLAFYAALYLVEPGARRGVIREALDLMDLSSRRESRIADLSLGMQQRLSLARLLIHDPKVLLLDEPAAGLDPSARIELREMLTRLSSLGKTILVSSHILSDIARICDRVGILEKGKLLFQGPLADLVLKLGGAPRAFRVLLDRREIPQAEALARRHLPGADVTSTAKGLVVTLGGDPESPGRLFAALVKGGVAVRRFSEDTPDLEKAFLKLTRGEVA